MIRLNTSILFGRQKHPPFTWEMSVYRTSAVGYLFGTSRPV
jgi:hypothetical protein